MTINVFDEPYFHLNRNLLSTIGFLPYGSNNKLNLFIRFSMITLSFVQMLPHVVSAVMHYQNIDRFMLNLVVFITVSVMFLKLVALSLSQKQFEEMFNSMAENFQTIRDENERKILISYSENGRLLTTCYMSLMTLCGILILSLPGFPKLYDLIDPLDEPRPFIYLMEGEYFFDQKSHKFLVFFWDSLTTIVVTTITISADSMYMSAAEHACALYAIISFRLRNLKPTDNPSSDKDDEYEYLCLTIKLHQKALQFTSTMGDSYSMTFLFIMIVNVALIPLVACRIIASLDTLVKFLPYILYFNALFIHLSTIFFPGQRILDHGTRLYQDSFCNEWYTVTPRSKKLLLIFMLRCAQPVTLSGGGLFMIDIKTFASITKTSISYITVLASFRDE